MIRLMSLYTFKRCCHTSQNVTHLFKTKDVSISTPALSLRLGLNRFHTGTTIRLNHHFNFPLNPSSFIKQALWKRLAIVATIGGIVAYMFYSVHHDRVIREEQVRYEEFQKAELGGDWTLIDHHGNKRSSTEFRGEWILMYFGFTHCPDICPEELEKLVKIVKGFDDNPKLPSMMPIFITLDPERDTPKAIKEYLNDYNCPRLLGFTAPTEDAIREVATKYRAYFSKGQPDEDNDYIVDHTIIIYLVNPKGEFVNYFDRSRSAERIIKTVTEHIQKFNELEGKQK